MLVPAVELEFSGIIALPPLVEIASVTVPGPQPFWLVPDQEAQ